MEVVADPIEPLSLWGWCDFTAGWISGIGGIFVGHPADTMKVRQQTLHHLTPIGIIKNTYQFEGLRGFFKGMMFPALTAGLVNSIFFGIYGNTLRQLQDFHGVSDHRRTCAEGETPIHKYWHLDVYLAGCIAGFSTVIVNCPVEVVKIKLQSQTGTAKTHWADHFEAGYKGPVDCAKHLFQEQGIKGFYRGFHCMVWRDMPTFGIYVLAYEHLLSTGRSSTDFSSDYSIARQVIAGGIAGIASWSLILPIDVVKSRLQADNPSNPEYKGIFDCMVKSYRADGIGVFARGFWLISIRAFAVNAAVFVGMEWCLDLCQTLTQRFKALYKQRLANKLIFYIFYIIFYIFYIFYIIFYADVIASGIYMLTYVRSVEAAQQPKHVATVLLAGGFAGAVSWAAILPLDVVKSRLQADNPSNPTYKGIIDCMVKSYHSDGIGVFGRGFWLICMRAFAVNAAVFVGLESCLDICQTMSEKINKIKQLFETKR